MNFPRAGFALLSTGADDSDSHGMMMKKLVQKQLISYLWIESLS
jgi:hypothetical protein